MDGDRFPLRLNRKLEIRVRSDVFRREVQSTFLADLEDAPGHPIPVFARGPVPG